MSILGNNIKQLRKQKKISQQKLGELLGASQTSIAHYELGTREPSVETLKMMSNIFNETIDNLIGNELTEAKSADNFIKEEKENITDLLFNALLEKDDRLFLELIQNNVIGVYPLIQIMDEILKNILYKVGSLWNEGTITEADEHYASNQIRKVISYISILNMKSIKTKSAVTLSIGSERHTIGIEMVNTYLESIGVKALYLGTNMPFRGINDIIQNYQPDYIFVSITMYEQINNLTLLVNYINENTDNPIPVFIGGQGYQQDKELEKNENVFFIKSLEDIKQYL